MSSLCTSCGAPLIWAAEQGAWYCPQESIWVQPAPQIGHPAQAQDADMTPAPASSKTWLVAGGLLAVVGVIAGFVLTRNDGGDSSDARLARTPGDGVERASATRPRAVVAVKGPAVFPVITKNITFVTPKPGVTWAEMAFPCYRAAIEMGDGGSAADPFYQASPMIKPALEAADISIERDIAAMGGWACGESPCFYIAAAIRQPQKIGDMVTMFAQDAKEPEPLHWSFDAPGASGARTIHVQVLPIQWGDSVPVDPWSTDMAKATHVIFLQGLFGGAEVDLLSALVTGKQAADRVGDAEAVLDDTRGRCVVGTVGSTDFKPGFDLESSRFALGLPPAKADPIARMLGSNRTMNVEVELALSAAPTEADVTRWIEEARTWLAGVGAPIRAQFASQGEMVQIMFESVELIAIQGFRHDLTGTILRLSWRTDRVDETSLVRMEADLQRLQGP